MSDGAWALGGFLAGAGTDGGLRAAFDDALRQLEAQQFFLAATGLLEAHDLRVGEFVEMYVACRAAAAGGSGRDVGAD